MTDTFAVFTESAARKILHAANEVHKTPPPDPPTTNKLRTIGELTSPVIITGNWTLEAGTWKCRARRLWRIDGIYQTLDDNIEFDLYHPTHTQESPPEHTVGSRVFAFYRGVWEVVSTVSTLSTVSTTVPEELTVPVFYPALQAVNDCETEDGEYYTNTPPSQADPDNAYGLTDEGTVPYEAVDGLYYKNIQPVVQEGFVQPDGTKWKFEYVDGTPCELDAIALKYTNGNMAGWETTDDVNLALKFGHRLILPHNVIGYTLGNEVTFKNTGGAAVPIIKEEFKNKPIIGKADIQLRRQDDTVIDTITDLLEAESARADLPEYQNDKPLIEDSDTLENKCDGKPLIGLWKDKHYPQLLYGENIPYGYCIPLKNRPSLTQTDCEECDAPFNTAKYTIALTELGDNRIYMPLNVDYKPSIKCK